MEWTGMELLRIYTAKLAMHHSKSTVDACLVLTTLPTKLLWMGLSEV